MSKIMRLFSIIILLLGIFISTFKLFMKTFNLNIIKFSEVGFILIIIFIIISIIYSIFAWRKEKLYSFIPLAVSLFSLVLIVISFESQENIMVYSFNSNYTKYSKVVVDIEKSVEFQKGIKWYKLPDNFKKLSVKGFVNIKKDNNNFNVVFFYKTGLLTFDAFVYSSSDNLLSPLNEEQHFFKKKLKPNCVAARPL